MKHNTNTTSASSSWNQDVALGLRGLDQADALVRQSQSQQEQALQLYERALELLIACLSSSQNKNNQYSQGLQTRVQQAMTQAEALKAKLERQKQQKEKTRGGLKKNQTVPSTTETITNDIRTAVRRRKQQQQNQQRQNRSSPPKQLSPRTPSPKNATTPTLSGGSPQEQELRQTILTDFYVPASDLAKTTWDDISGLASIKQSLQEVAILPLLRPDLLTGLRQPQHILLYGPPGTGKTLLVRAVAQASQSNLFVVTSSAVTSKWMGDSEKLLRTLFDVARQVAPSILFLDEVDALLGQRGGGNNNNTEHEASRRLKTEFMIQMEGIQQKQQPTQQQSSSSATTTAPRHILVIACTNCPWDIDPAVLRRFPRRLLVPLPDRPARRALLDRLLQKEGKHSLTSRQVDILVDRMQGFSCSDITAVASEASFGPLRSLGDWSAISTVAAKDIRPLSFDDFDAALQQTTKSITPEQLQRYDEWQRQQSVK